MATNTLHTMQLLALHHAGGIDAIFDVCQTFMSIIEGITNVKTEERSEAQKWELAHAYRPQSHITWHPSYHADVKLEKAQKCGKYLVWQWQTWVTQSNKDNMHVFLLFSLWPILILLDELFKTQCDLWQTSKVFSLGCTVICDWTLGRNSIVCPDFGTDLRVDPIVVWQNIQNNN
jgi:hypothetical protein